MSFHDDVTALWRSLKHGLVWIWMRARGFDWFCARSLSFCKDSGWCHAAVDHEIIGIGGQCFFRFWNYPQILPPKILAALQAAIFSHKSINFNELCYLCPPQAENFAVLRACFWFSDRLRANPEENLPTNFGDYSRSNLIYPQIFKNLWVITAKKNTEPKRSGFRGSEGKTATFELK